MYPYFIPKFHLRSFEKNSTLKPGGMLSKHGFSARLPDARIHVWREKLFNTMTGAGPRGDGKPAVWRNAAA
jgi:hypothetical protein